MPLTLNGNGSITGESTPVFAGYANAATTLALNANKLNLQAVEFDTASCFNTSLSRYTPNVAGYYSFNGGTSASLLATGDTIAVGIYKNGVVHRWGMTTAYPANRAHVTSVVYMNGTTDYVELYCWRGGSAGTVTGGNTSADTFLQGHLVRAA